MDSMSAQGAINVRNKVSNLQTKLSHAAKQSLCRRFGALYDKLYRKDVLYESWKRVKANKGAPGVDKHDFEYIETVIGVGQFLGEIREELRRYRYKPQPVLRCYIDKPGRSEKRPLGIPVIKDRVIQMAAKLVIEPIFEANFLQCSYGFRPGCSAHQAIEHIRRMITFKHYTVIVDADIKGYFDNICHEILMKLLRKRISDPHLLRLIQSWLEAGVVEDGKYIETSGVGTPQGGVISPLLANIYLHSFDKMFQMSGIPGVLVRYCDDFVILVRRDGMRVLEQVRRLLLRLKLQLNQEKTRIVRAELGFDFLGMHFRLRPVKKPSSWLKHFCHIWPSDSSLRRIRQRIRDVIDRRYSLSLEQMVKELNPVIRGWNNYHTVYGSCRKRRRKLNWFVHHRLRIFLKRKYSDPSRGYRRVSNSFAVRLGLCQFG
ncbi:MAG: group II intron reverse transcriptase/maturase [Woeseiaceae bacterium]|jgi:group II intron reverse transcriptase/maturase